MTDNGQSKELIELQQLFRRSVMKLALAGKGVHQKLDQKLEAIRQLVRDQEDVEKLAQAIESLTDTLVELETHKSHLDQVYDQQQIIEELVHLTRSKQKKQQLKLLQQELEQLSEREYFQRLIKIYTAEPAKREAKLFSWGRDSKAQVEVKNNDVVDSMREKLGYLLNAIVVESVGVSAELVFDEFHEIEQIPDILEQLNRIILDAKSAEQERIEDFFEQLGDRLAKFHSLLSMSDNDQQQGHQESQAFGSDLRNQLNGLQQTTQQATSLKELSSSVDKGLNGIIKVLDDFQQKLEQRYTSEQNNIRELQQELAQTRAQTQDLQQALVKEQQKAQTDVLTELPNRLGFNQRARLEVARSKRYNQPLSIAIADIDKFKQINDEYGHSVGDKVLQMVATHCSVAIRETDFVARVGGEEFVFLLPETDLEQAHACLEKLRKLLETRMISVDNHNISATLSFGVTQLQEVEELDAALERADTALYRAKQSGRNRICKAD